MSEQSPWNPDINESSQEGIQRICSLPKRLRMAHEFKSCHRKVCLVWGTTCTSHFYAAEPSTIHARRPMKQYRLLSCETQGCAECSGFRLKRGTVWSNMYDHLQITVLNSTWFLKNMESVIGLWMCQPICQPACVLNNAGLVDRFQINLIWQRPQAFAGSFDKVRGSMQESSKSLMCKRLHRELNCKLLDSKESTQQQPVLG